jgi:hypothetical protein
MTPKSIPAITVTNTVLGNLNLNPIFYSTTLANQKPELIQRSSSFTGANVTSNSFISINSADKASVTDISH